MTPISQLNIRYFGVGSRQLASLPAALEEATTVKVKVKVKGWPEWACTRARSLPWPLGLAGGWEMPLEKPGQLAA